MTRARLGMFDSLGTQPTVRTKPPMVPVRRTSKRSLHRRWQYRFRETNEAGGAVEVAFD